MDAKDILGLPKHALPVQEKKSKPPKESQRKPDGISREVYALTGGMVPLMPTIDVNQLKRKSQNDKITWQWLPFTSSARKDDLQLYHWLSNLFDANAMQSVDVIKYTDEEYEKYLSDTAWTKEETDQLFDMCEQFDLRFIVIADRFPSTRTVEELKHRYYSVSRTILIARAPSPSDVAGHPLVKDPYNETQEKERKRSLALVLSHTKQQERRDVEVLAEAKRISVARKTIKAPKESELPVISDVPVGIDVDTFTADTVSPSANSQITSSIVTNSVCETASVMASLRMLHVYLRTYALEQMVQAASSSAGLRTIKRLEQTLQDLGFQHKEAEGSSYRDGSYSETPGTPTKRPLRAADLDRTFTPDSLTFGGERFGKRDQKRKGHGRSSEAPSSPAQSKRPRKF
ncbi:hypothetical protein RD792_016031 [Penstemon davidsonii]|uniref:Myb-like domain-containing protein n=1 Tax=Penstemon davidsonii TaxID=160366 RepID=A0ABR0CJ54_9LAMI|nr:hypothetical protein RD792_016031 [Penstemon davidsonii]